MLTLSDLKTAKDELVRAKTSGVRTARFGDDEVTYKSDAEMAAALASLDAQIAEMERGRSARLIYPTTSKGL